MEHFFLDSSRFMVLQLKLLKIFEIKMDFLFSKYIPLFFAVNCVDLKSWVIKVKTNKIAIIIIFSYMFIKLEVCRSWVGENGVNMDTGHIGQRP